MATTTHHRDVENATTSSTTDETETMLQPLNLKSSSSSSLSDKKSSSSSPKNDTKTVTTTGLQVLILLAVQNCSKNLLMRYVMKDKPNFLTSAAVIGVELLKLCFSTLYILCIEKASLKSIITFLRVDYKSSILMAVPAAAYSLQMSLEYVALSHIDAALFSVLVQSKLLATACFAYVVMRKKLRKVQTISLVLLMAGVMLCNLKDFNGKEGGLEMKSDALKGVIATLGIALSSGFASVYTEKVIKGNRANNNENSQRRNYSLAYVQVQLAVVSLIIIGVYAAIKDYNTIMEYGLWYNFNTPAFISILNSAIGGLIVAAVLKYADAVLKGYATAISVVFTGILSMVLFGTNLNIIYALGIINVVCSVILYNGKDLDVVMC